MTEWTDPIIIVGGAQIFMALVLALFTAFLWKSTDKYAKLTEKDLEIKEKIRQTERLHKELDSIIGPVYSKLGDPIYFNSKPTNWTMWYPDNEKLQATYRGSEFWRNIKKNLYLTPPQIRKSIKEYLDIKLGIAKFGEDENNSGYKACLENITDAVEDRYKAIIDELKIFEG